MIYHKYARWIELGLLLIMAVLLAYMTWLERQQQAVSDELIRLHVVAESDGQEDQQIKLSVKDAVLRIVEPMLSDAETKEEAQKILLENQLLLKETANGVLISHGKAATAEISFKRELFGTRDYGDFSLPGGYYDALKIVLGGGEGKNWWCVVYPQICTMAVSESYALPVMGTENIAEWIIYEDESDYEFRLKMVELFENLMGWFRSGDQGIPVSG